MRPLRCRGEGKPRNRSPSEALSLIQCTICLVGNASELTSQLRRERILTAIDPSWSKFWSKFGSEQFSMKSNTLFGEDFQSKLTSMVEKDMALVKAVSIAKRHKKDKSSLSSHQKSRALDCPFFSKGPPGKYGDRWGKNFQPYPQNAGPSRDTNRGLYLSGNQTGYPRQHHQRSPVVFNQE